MALDSYRKDRTGLALVIRPDRLVVAHVAPGSPAEAARWRVGEEIVSINGRAIDAAYNASDLWKWRYQPSGTKVRMTMSHGEVRHLVLADYD